MNQSVFYSGKDKNECNENFDDVHKKKCKDPCDFSKYKYIQCFGPTGPIGSTGPQGSNILNYADFYALMPPDNSATVAPGTDISFPQDGPISGTSITRIGASSFNLSEIGVYQILF